MRWYSLAMLVAITVATEDAAGQTCTPLDVKQYVNPAPGSTLSAVFYFPWHTGSPDCPASSRWCDCIMAAKPGQPRPYLGFYDSAEPDIVDQQLDQMVAHGVDVVGIEWAGGFEVDNFRDVVLPALAVRNLKFVLLYDFAIRFDGIGYNFDDEENVRNEFIEDFTDFASLPEYFRHPKYLKFNNKPVVYFYTTRIIAGASGNVAAAFEAARNAAIANNFNGLYVVADHLWWQGTNWSLLNAIGASAASSFGPVTPEEGVGGPTPVRVWADKMSTLYSDARDPLLALDRLVDLQPGIFPQYNDEGLATPACNQRSVVQSYHLSSIDDWRYMIDTAAIPHRRIAKRFVRDSNCNETTTLNSEGKSIIWTYSYNEWAEGTGIERLDVRNPPFPYGFGLQALQTLAGRVHSNGGNQPPAPPVPRFPLGIVEGLRPTFIWDAIPGGLQYQVHVFDEADNLVFDPPPTVAATTWRPGSDMAAGDYYWQVRGQNNAGWSSLSTPRTFTLVPQETEPPTAPEPLRPDGCIPQHRPTFEWTAADRAVDYKIAIFEVDPEFLTIYEEVDGLSYRPPFPLVADRAYRWKVKSRNSIGEAWSSMLYFTPGCGSTPSSLSISDAWRAEGSSGQANAAFTITISPPRPDAGTVVVDTVNETATAGQDYVGVTGLVVNLPANAASVTVPIAILGDAIPENDETFVVNLSNPSPSFEVLDPQGRGTIVNDDYILSIDDAAITEANSGGSNATFTVTIFPPLPQPGSVTVSTADGTAVHGLDYIGTTGYTLTLPAQAPSVTFPVVVVGDTTYEADETFSVLLSNPSAGISLADGQGQGTILNDDPMPALTANDAVVLEGNGGTRTVSINVWLSAPAGLPVTVSFATTDGTATAGADYVARTGSVVFPAGVTSRDVDVLVNGDLDFESDEEFHIDLTAPVNATIADGRGTVTIATDESPWTIPATGDFNHDGRVDILWTSEATHAHRLWPMNGIERLDPEDPRHGLPFGPQATDPDTKIVGSGQFNLVPTQDGNPADTETDVVVFNTRTGKVTLWLLNGYDLVRVVPTWPAGRSDPSWMAVTTGDFNRDGHQDIVWRNKTSGEVAVWFMRADVLDHEATLEGPPMFPPPVAEPDWEDPRAGDLNADGWVDLIFRDGISGHLVVWTLGPNAGGQDGVRRLAQLPVIKDGQETQSGPLWRLGGTGDFNLGGYIDLVWRNHATGQSFVWYLGGVVTAPNGVVGVAFAGEQMLIPEVVW